jgi:hypothetical protein
MLLFLKSTIHAHGQSDLFPQTVSVKGHVRRNVFIKPHLATRNKAIEEAPHQVKPKPIIITKPIDKTPPVSDTPNTGDKAMPKLSKTEITILKRAKESRSGRVSVLVTQHNGHWPIRTIGNRERNAADALRAKGLLEFLNSSQNIHYGYEGVTTRGFESLWAITDKGRAHDLGA